VGKVQISVFWVERILEESVVSSIRVNTWWGMWSSYTGRLTTFPATCPYT
jgi:hypothetical protein